MHDTEPETFVIKSIPEKFSDMLKPRTVKTISTGADFAHLGAALPRKIL